MKKPDYDRFLNYLQAKLSNKAFYRVVKLLCHLQSPYFVFGLIGACLLACCAWSVWGIYVGGAVLTMVTITLLVSYVIIYQVYIRTGSFNLAFFLKPMSLIVVASIVTVLIMMGVDWRSIALFVGIYLIGLSISAYLMAIDKEQLPEIYFKKLK